MIKTIKLFLLIVVCIFGNAQNISQVQLLPGKNYNILHSNPLLPLVEPHLAINPKNSNHMIVAAIAFDSAATSENRTHIVVFTTKDNWKSWKQSDLPMTVGFDPWVSIKDDSTAALVGLVGYGKSHMNGLVYFSSSDGGLSWNDTVNFKGGHDHPTMIVDARRNNRLYILSVQGGRDSFRRMHSYAWLNFTDNWRQFPANARRIDLGEVNSNTLAATMRPDGILVLPFVEYGSAPDPSFKFISTRDAANFSTPQFITSRASLGKGFAVFATDMTGKFKGRTYFIKNTGPSPSRSDGIFLQYVDSVNGSWSADVRVDHNVQSVKFMRTAAIAVNKDGVIGIVWVDRRNDPNLEKNDIYFTISVDGGRTFNSEIKVTDVSSSPATAGNGKAGERFISGGDYMGCVAKSDGSFQLLWADSRSGVFQLYTANVKLK